MASQESLELMNAVIIKEILGFIHEELQAISASPSREEAVSKRDSIYAFIRRKLDQFKRELQTPALTVFSQLKEHCESKIEGLRRELVLIAARQRFGIDRCEFHDGVVWVTAGDGTRHRVQSESDLANIPTESTAKQQPDQTKTPLSEDLEEEPPQKRRKMNKLIVDQRTKISSDNFAVRVGNKDVEQRCDSVSQDKRAVSVPVPLSRAQPTARLGRALAATYARGSVEDVETSPPHKRSRRHSTLDSRANPWLARERLLHKVLSAARAEPKLGTPVATSTPLRP